MEIKEIFRIKTLFGTKLAFLGYRTVEIQKITF